MHTSPLSDWQDQVPVVFLISFQSKIPSNTQRSWFLLAQGCWQDCCCPFSLPVTRSWSFERLWTSYGWCELCSAWLSRDFVASSCVEWTKPVLPALCSSLTVKSLSFREFKVWFECSFYQPSLRRSLCRSLQSGRGVWRCCVEEKYLLKWLKITTCDFLNHIDLFWH